MSWRGCGAEWHPVLVALAVLAVGVLLAMVAWPLGLAWALLCIVAFLVVRAVSGE